MVTKKYYPKKYIPKYLTNKDAKKIKNEIEKSKEYYKKTPKKYYIRKGVKSMKIKESKHIKKAKKIYNIKSMKINKELSRKTGCKIEGLEKIVNKGRGAYYSSGSRPGQTPDSWGYARLASAVTGGKSSAVDYKIIEKYCNKTSKAYKMAKKSEKKYKRGTRKIPKRLI